MITDRPPAEALVLPPNTTPPRSTPRPGSQVLAPVVVGERAVNGERLQRRRRRRRLLKEQLLVVLILLVVLGVTVAILATQWLGSGPSVSAGGGVVPASGPPPPYGGTT